MVRRIPAGQIASTPSGEEAEAEPRYAAPVTPCYAGEERTSVSRFRSNPTGRCIAIVRPNWKLFNPALPRSAPQVLVIAHFEQCLTDQPALHAGGCAANRKLLETIDRQAIYAWLQ